MYVDVVLYQDHNFMLCIKLNKGFKTRLGHTSAARPLCR